MPDPPVDPNYEWGEPLGPRGSYGHVYRARRLTPLPDTNDSAVKVLDGDLPTPVEVINQFRSESQLLRQLGEHPHVALVNASPRLENQGWEGLAMELLAGGSLQEQTLNLEEAAAAVIVTADLLHFAHAINPKSRAENLPRNLLFSTVRGQRRMLKLTRIAVADQDRDPRDDVRDIGELLARLIENSSASQNSGFRAALIGVRDRALQRAPQRGFADTEELGVAVATAARVGCGRDWLKRGGVIQPSSERIRVALSADPPPPPPPDPRDSLADLVWTAVVLLGAAALLLFIGVLRDGAEPPRGLVVGEVEVGEGAVVPVDLSKPVRVRFEDLPAGTATKIQLGLLVDGMPLVSSQSEPLVGSRGTYVASLDVPVIDAYLAAGRVTAELRLQDGDAKTLQRFGFTVRPARRWSLLLPLAAAALLFTLLLWDRDKLDRQKRSGQARLKRKRIGCCGLLFVGIVGAWMLLPVRFVICLAAAGVGCGAVAFACWRRSRAPSS